MSNAPGPNDHIGRYVVHGEIAAGGWGVVYAAFDPELHRKVALKLLHRQIGEGAGERILREARAMARLSHPNVVGIYDVGTWNEQVFIAMELVEGGTLASWLQEKPRSWREIVQLFLLAGRGLAAAHAAGLVHRDFKPENVLVGKDGRVLVTDFGLARAGRVAPDPALAVAVGSNVTGIAGSPDYMAPELMRGEPASVRSDIFSFCVSLHESLYGGRPFVGRSLEELLDSIEKTPPIETAGRPRAPVFLRRIIARGLKPRAEDRFASMEPLLDALARDPLKKALWPLAAVALAGLASALAWLARPPPPPAQRPSIALVEPAARPEGSAWLGPAVGELLSAELALDPRLRVIPAERVAAALRELHLAPGPLTGEAAKALAAQLGADEVVSGSVEAEPQLALSLAVAEGASGATRTTLEARGDARQLGPLASDVGPRLRKAAGGDASVATTAAESSFPRNPEAAQLYAKALGQMAAFEAAQARDTLERAAAIEPDSPRIQGTLAEAYRVLGYDAKARDAATLAFQHASSLAPRDRFRIESIYRRAIGDTAGAVALAQKRYRLARDDVEAGLDLVSAYEGTGNTGPELIQLLDELRRLPDPQGSDPRLDLAQASALNINGDGKAGRAFASRAALRGVALGARRVVARARFLEAQALVLQGNRPDAATAYIESERLYREAGDRGSSAKASMAIGTVLADTGDLDGARARFDSAWRVFHDVGDRRAEAAASGNLAILLRRARRRLPEALEMARRTRTAMMEMGIVGLAEHALALAAEIERDLGDLAGARADYEETIRSMRANQSPGPDRKLLGLAEVELRQGAFADARRTLAEAMATPGKESYTPPVHDMLMARLELEENHPAQAEQLARAALAQSAAFERPEQAGGARGLLALALLARGKPAEASAEAATAAALVKPLSELGAAVALAQARATAAAHPDQLPQSIGAAEAVAEEARKSGIVNDLLEARFAIGALEKQARRPGARASLTALAREARQRGHLAVAARAEALAR